MGGLAHILLGLQMYGYNSANSSLASVIHGHPYLHSNKSCGDVVNKRREQKRLF